MKKLTTATFGTALALALGLALTPAGVSAQDQVATLDEGTPQIQVTILGMSCPFCAYGAEKKLKKLDGVVELEVVLETGLATLTMEEGADVSNETLQEAVEDAGFEIAKITRTFESEYPDYDAEDGA